MEHFCNTSCKGEWQRKQRESLGFTREWLIEQYIVRNRSASEIASDIGRDSKRVWEWIRDYGIPRRPRGHNPPPPRPKTKPERKKREPKVPLTEKDLTRNALISEYEIKRRNPSRIAIIYHSTNEHVRELFGDFGIQLHSTVANGGSFRGRKHTPETKKKIHDARIRDGHVPYLKGGVHWLRGKKGAEHPSYRGGSTPERQVFYSTPEWIECAKAIRKRDLNTCQRCNRKALPKERTSFHIHHIDSFTIKSRRLAHDNLILLCRDCHLWVHSKKNASRELLGKGH
jgi:5-methylcytosine-specific restriction endonuclease McrA